MNLKTIISTAGVALLSLSFTGATFAEECTFVMARQATPTCWARIDSCGGVTYIGRCPTSLRKPRVKKAPVKAASLSKGTVFVPDPPPACTKGAE